MHRCIQLYGTDDPSLYIPCSFSSGIITDTVTLASHLHCRLAATWKRCQGFSFCTRATCSQLAAACLLPSALSSSRQPFAAALTLFSLHLSTCLHLNRLLSPPPTFSPHTIQSIMSKPGCSPAGGAFSLLLDRFSFISKVPWSQWLILHRSFMALHLYSQHSDVFFQPPSRTSI